jgi:transposase
MTAELKSKPAATLVVIDIAKQWNVAVALTPDGRRRQFRVANSFEDHDRFVAFLRSQPAPCQVAMEPTGTYHRPLAYRLAQEGFEVRLVSSLAAARCRDAFFNSWDKNDPKDAGVILRLMEHGQTLVYYDPVLAGTHDLQELSKTYMQVSLARTRLHHSMMTHYVPLYWPEFERFWRSSRADWVVPFLRRFPVPAAVRALDLESFVREAWPLVGRKVAKRRVLAEIYELSSRTIGLPAEPESLAVRAFRLQLDRYQSLLELRGQLEEWAETTLVGNSDYEHLKSIPGIGPVLALVILAEAGDLRRFGHHRQFLKFCGLDLAKNQSGASRGPERLSKRGNARLRCAFWFAGVVAVRLRENSFRSKFDRYMRVDPLNRDRRRKALTAIAAKMARVAYGLVKTGSSYRAYFEASLPSGSIPLTRAVGAARTP